jgi:4-amino-4-deoxy-L-arabinose transferase-like glycosyltransferase
LKKINSLWFYLPALFVMCFRILTPDLGEWDERFHALAAKNLSENPLVPVLLDDTLIRYDADLWDRSHIWLAKPPLALWCMAGSIKIFGTNEIAARIPSFIFYCITLYLVFLIGSKLYGKKMGLFASLLFCYNGLLLDIFSGRLAGDHVDALYLLLFHLTIWFTLLFLENRTYPYLAFIGISIGLSFMTKWTMALFPLIVSMCILAYKVSSFSTLLLNYFKICCIAALLSIPWLWYLHTNFMADFDQLMANVVTPMYKTIQNHRGNLFYYLDRIRIYINELVYFGLALLPWKFKKISFQRFVLGIWIFVPLFCLSLFETKREVYILMAATPMFISLILFARYFAINFKSKIGKYSKLVYVAIFVLSLRTYGERFHFFRESTEYPEYRLAAESLLTKSNRDSIILFREPKFCQIRYFYGIKAYPWIDDTQAAMLKTKGYELYELSSGKYVER